MRWLWVLQTSSGQGGTNLSTLAGATGRQLNFKRSSIPTASGEIPLDHDDAVAIVAALGNGIPLLRCFRFEPQADGTQLAVCRFAGDLMPQEEIADDDVLKFTAQGAFNRFEGYVIGDPDLPFVRDLADAGDIMADVLAEMNAEADTGIDLGTVEPSVALDVSYDGKRGGEVFNELAATQGGPDFEIVPLADALGQGGDVGRLEVYTRQGEPRPEAVFGYGEGTVGNCTDASRQWLKPRNRVIVTGDEGLRVPLEDTDSIVKYGLWTHTEAMSDVIDLPLLEARAGDLLRPDPIRLVKITPDPAARDDASNLITPVPGIHYWLGDEVPVTIRKGALQYDGQARLDSIGITIDDDGNESAHTVEFEEAGAVA